MMYIVYKVINMDIFLTKTHIFHLRRPLLTPRMDYFYDEWMHFFGFQNLRYYSLPL